MKKTIIETLRVMGFLSSLLLIILSYKISHLNLDKIGIIVFLTSAFINAAHWCKIIESKNKSTNSINEAIKAINQICNENSSCINRKLRPQFKNINTLEYRFQKLERKDLVAAMIVMNENLKQIIPIVILLIMPIWLIGTSHFHYQRYYAVSPVLHDTLLYLLILALGTISWPMTSDAILSYLIKIRYKRLMKKSNIKITP